jgi:hypothetical protein
MNLDELFKLEDIKVKLLADSVHEVLKVILAIKKDDVTFMSDAFETFYKRDQRIQK